MRCKFSFWQWRLLQYSPHWTKSSVKCCQHFYVFPVIFNQFKTAGFYVALKSQKLSRRLFPCTNKNQIKFLENWSKLWNSWANFSYSRSKTPTWTFSPKFSRWRWFQHFQLNEKRKFKEIACLIDRRSGILAFRTLNWLSWASSS
jgi:hypothetical protein